MEEKSKCNDSPIWMELYSGDLHIYIPQGVKQREKVAAFDMDWTLIKTKSNEIFPQDIYDWQIAFPEVPDKLKSAFDDGFQIVIFTNQAGVSHSVERVAEMKIKIESIVAKLSVPIQVFISTGRRNLLRKPLIGMWNELTKDRRVSKEKSFYVGDAAGRPKDYSSIDRLFALNIGLKFYTPEQFFLGCDQHCEWLKPAFEPSSVFSIKRLSDIEHFVSNEPELVVMVGAPASGKSFFANEYLLKAGYTYVNQDSIASLEQTMESKQRIVVDERNPDERSRKRYVEVAKRCGVRVRCFKMNTTLEHSLHNNAFREVTDLKHRVLDELEFCHYESAFKEPSVGEGFAEIVNINFVPRFTDAEKEKLYKMYLLDHY